MRQFVLWASIFCIVLSAGAGGSALYAELPKVRHPRNPGEPKLRTPAPQPPDEQEDQQAETLRLMEERRRQAMMNHDSEQPPTDDQPVDRIGLQLMMKNVSDPALGLPATLERHYQQMSAFGSLKIELQDEAVPELLALLQNREPLPDGRYAMRDKALAALSCLAGVTFGGFTQTRENDNPAAGEATDDAELIRKWQKWWDEVRPLDDAGRKAVGSRHRRELIERHLDDPGHELVQNNINFAVQAKDSSLLPILARVLENPQPQRKDEITAVLGYYEKLYSSGRRDASHVRPILKFARAVNEPQLAHQTNWPLAAGQILTQMTQVRVNLYQFEKIQVQMEDGTTREISARVIQDAALEEFEKWIDEQQPPPSAAGNAPAGGHD